MDTISDPTQKADAPVQPFSNLFLLTVLGCGLAWILKLLFSRYWPALDQAIPAERLFAFMVPFTFGVSWLWAGAREARRRRQAEGQPFRLTGTFILVILGLAVLLLVVFPLTVVGLVAWVERVF
jgi:hypothetical protein